MGFGFALARRATGYELGMLIIYERTNSILNDHIAK